MATSTDLESLRKVHQTLTDAIKTAESAVNAQLAQRRFWLEEICSNLDEEGNIHNASIWKRPMPVKAPPGKKSVAKATSLKRKKNSLESSETKPAKKPRKKKNDGEPTGTTTKSTAKKGPTVKIKMKTLPVPSEVRAPSPDSEDTESQKDDDEESSAGSHQVAQLSDHNSDWESAGDDNPLAIMVRGLLDFLKFQFTRRTSLTHLNYSCRPQSPMERTQPLNLPKVAVQMIINLRSNPLHNIAPRSTTTLHMVCEPIHLLRMLAPRMMTRMKINSRETQLHCSSGSRGD